MNISRRGFMAAAAAGAVVQGVRSAEGGGKKDRDAVVYVAAHPDDLAGSIGTVMRLAEMYDVHVVDYTHGERGMGRARFEDGSCKKMRTEEEERICKEIGVTLHWCDEIDGEAFAGRETCMKLADLFRKINPRALIVHWFTDIHNDHMMSTAAAVKAAQLARIQPEIYFQEQESQSRGFLASYYVDVSKYTERRRQLISVYKSQDGASIAERKIETSRANARRICGVKISNAEVFGVFPGTVPAGKGIFDAMPGVYR